MTAFTQREQIVIIMSATVCQWQDMMNLLRRRQPALLPALLA